MIQEIDKKQLALLLKITADDARRMMIVAWCKAAGTKINMGNEGSKFKYFDDDYPKKMDVDMLARELNLPLLRMAIDDIHKNYLKRGATRGYILNYPRQIILQRLSAGDKSPLEIDIPPTLKSFLSIDDREEIVNVWKERFKGYDWVTFI